MENHSPDSLHKSESPASESEDEIEFIGVSRSCTGNSLFVVKNTLSLSSEQERGLY